MGVPAGQLDIEIVTNLVRLMSEMEQVKRAVGSTMGAVGASTKAANDNLLQLARTSQDVATRINAMTGVTSAGMRRSAEDIAAYGAELDRLRAKYNPVFAVVQQYRASLEDIRRAHAVGAISADEMAAAISRERQASLASIGAIKGRKTALDEAAAAARAAAQADAEVARQQAVYASQASALRAQLHPMFAAQQRFNVAMDQADDLLRAGAISTREYAAAQELARTNLQQHARAVAGSSAVINTAAKSLKLCGLEVLNFSRQLADVGVSAGMGMNPLMIALQQGPQMFDILQTKAVATGATIGSVARAAGAQIWAAVAPLLPIILAIAAAVATVSAAFALGARNINESNGSVIKGLGLTEKQLERVKKSGVDTAVTMGDTFFAFFDVVGDRLQGAFDGPLKWLAKAWDTTLNTITFIAAGFIKAMVGGWLGLIEGIAASWRKLPAAIGDIMMQIVNGAIAAFELYINATIKGLNLLSSTANKVFGTSFDPIGAVDLGQFENKFAGAGQDFAQAFAQGFTKGAKEGGAIVDRFFDDVAKRAVERREKALREAAGDAEKGPKGPKSEAAKFADLVADVTRDIAMIEAQTKALELSDEAALRLTNQQKLLNDAQAKGITVTDKQHAVLMGLAEVLTQAQLALQRGEAWKAAEKNIDGQIRALQQVYDRVGLYGQALDELTIYQDLLNIATNNGKTALKGADEAERAKTDATLLGTAATIAALKAEGDRKAFLENTAKATEDAVIAMERERGAIGLTGAALEAYRYETELLNKARQAGLDKDPTVLAGIKGAAAAYGEFRHETDDLLSAQDKLVAQFESVASAANDAAGTMADAFGDVGGAIGDVIAILADYGAQQQKIQADVLTGTLTQAEADRDLGNLQLSSMGQALGAAKNLFKEHSAGYKAMAAAEKAFAVVQLANTAINIAAGAAKMFAALGPFGFPAVAAMLAVMAGLGAAVSGGGGYRPPSAQEVQAGQGAGGVLGDSEAKSGSIGNALDLMLKNTNKDLEYSSEMVRSLRSIESNIGALTAHLARQLGLGTGGAFDQTGLGLGSSTKAPGWTNMLFGLGGAVLKEIPIIGNILGGIINALFGTKKKVTLLDQGITFAAQSVEDIINGGAIGQIYQDVQTQTKKKFLGLTTSNKTTVSTQYSDLDDDMERQVALIIGSMRAGIIDAAGALGVEGAQAALDAFTVNIGKISLKDLKGDEIQEQLEAVFSKLGDDMAGAAVAGLAEFQRVGEGLFETLARLAKDYATIDTALLSIGMTFSMVGASSIAARESLVDLFGSLDAFAEQTSLFRENFLSEAEQMAPIITAVNAEMARLGKSGVTTKDQLKEIVLGLDLSSESGREMYASLLAVAPAFAKVTEYLDGLATAAANAAEANRVLAEQLAADAERKLTEARAAEQSSLRADLGAGTSWQIRMLRATGQNAAAQKWEDDIEIGALPEIWRDYARAVLEAERAASQVTGAYTRNAKQDSDLAARLTAVNDNRDAAEEARAGRLDDLHSRLASAYEREAGTIRDVIDELKSARDGLIAYKDELRGVGASPAENFAMLRMRLMETGAKAGAGDVGAMQALPGAGKDFLAMALDRSRTEIDFRRQVNVVEQLVDKGIAAADGAIEWEQASLDAMTQAVEQHVQTNEKLDTVIGVLEELAAETADGNSTARQLLTGIFKTNSRIDRVQRNVTRGGTAMLTEAA